MGIKKIGPVLATALVTGNMVGSGIFLLPASLASIGSSTIIGWVVCLGGALLIAGVFAVLGASRPDPDGLVNWPGKGLHPVAGFVSWTGYWAANWIGNVAVALAAVGYAASLVPALKAPVGALIATLALIWIFTGLCLLGARVVTRFGGAMLLVGLLPIAAATILGLSAFSPETFAASWSVTGKSVMQTMPASLAIIFWAFLGLESAAVAAAVVDNPGRNVPIAVLGGVTLAGLIYMTASVAVMGVIPAAELAKSTAPFADVVARLAGPWVAAAVAICAALKACGTVSGFFLVAGEVSRSGAASGFLPRFMSESDPAQLPRRGLLVLGAMMSLVALATVSPTLNAQFVMILNVSVILVLAVYALCAAALLRDGTQSLRVRLLAVAAIAFCLFATWASGLHNTWPALAILGGAAVVWLGMQAVRPSTRRSAAAQDD
jgi:arginine:agmatine antiporter